MPLRKITVISDDKRTVLNARDGDILSDVLSKGGFAVTAACGRRGTCGKCAVKLVDGGVSGESPDENGMIRSCRAVINSDAVIAADFRQGSGLTDFSADESFISSVCGIAVDIGTTTVAAAITEPDGTARTASCLNPQSAYGADVISRINAAAKGKLAELTGLIRECVGNLINGLAGEKTVDELVVSGNATMLHLFCGVSPESMGVSPFTPQFTDAMHFDGGEFNLNVKKITVLPSVSAFVGGDIVAGIYALGLHRTDKKVFLADLGTNGELVFSDGGRLYCTSTAAGPALEGASIECGVGGIKGAVDRVYKNYGRLAYTTVGNANPVGICGAGLVDAIALMLSDEMIDESGYFEDERLTVCGNVYVSQKDVRQYQLAKSAVYSGIETLLETVGATAADIDSFFISGGLGYYISAENAVKTGLLPDIDTDRFHAAGNTSLQGALMCIGNPEAVEEMRRISKACRSVELGGNPAFNDRFMNNMFFSVV